MTHARASEAKHNLGWATPNLRAMYGRLNICTGYCIYALTIAYIYILDLHMTPSGVMLHVCELVAENLHRKLKEYPDMNVSAAAAAAV